MKTLTLALAFTLRPTLLPAQTPTPCTFRF